MNKTQLDHVKNRIESVVKCTNGEIATIMNRLNVGTTLTNNRKYKMICQNKAVVKDEHELVGISAYRHDNAFGTLLECFTYPETDNQAERRKFNDRIKRKSEELMQEVTLEGKRLLDSIVLDIIKLENVPNHLHKLGSMTSLARQFTKNHFTMKGKSEHGD